MMCCWRKPFRLKPGESWNIARPAFHRRESGGTDRQCHRWRWVECLLVYRPVDVSRAHPRPRSGDRAAAPAEMSSADELYFTGEHLELYRHPTRAPEPYWQEALRRDDGDCPLQYRHGPPRLAQRPAWRWRRTTSARRWPASPAAIRIRKPARPTISSDSPCSSQDGSTKPIGYLAKAAWNQAWRSAAHYQLACIDCRDGAFDAASAHLGRNRSPPMATTTRPRCCWRCLLRHDGDPNEALAILGDILEVDPLDHWARHEADASRRDSPRATF